MIAAKGLDAGYGKLQVLFDVNFKAEQGAITAVVGPNGSGKSTLLKAIAGVAKIFRGVVEIGGVDATRMAPHERARLGLAYLPQVKNVFQNLTVEENLRMAAYHLDVKEYKERLREVLKVVPIGGLLHRRALELSGGWRQMVAVAMALIRGAKYFMFDEPTAQLSPKFAEEVLKLVKKLAEMGYTVVLAEQNAKKALEIAHSCYLLVSGKVAYEGPPSGLLARADLAELYLGIKSI